MKVKIHCVLATKNTVHVKYSKDGGRTWILGAYIVQSPAVYDIPACWSAKFGTLNVAHSSEMLLMLAKEVDGMNMVARK